MTALQSFDEWLKTAKGGEVYVYAVRHVLDYKTPPETQAEALLAREAFARGEVELVQKRTAGSGSPFEYRAIKKRKQRVPMVNGVRWAPNITKPGYAGYFG